MQEALEKGLRNKKSEEILSKTLWFSPIADTDITLYERNDRVSGGKSHVMGIICLRVLRVSGTLLQFVLGLIIQLALARGTGC